MQLNATGGSICSTNGYLAAAGPVRQQFTGQQFDTESNLYYFNARFFSGGAGRFGSADEPFADQDPSSPQSWNLYGYARNNPVVNIDPSGQDCLYTYGATSSDTMVLVGVESGGCSSSAGFYLTGTVNTSTLSLNNGAIGYLYTPYSGGSLVEDDVLALPDLEFPGIQGQANYFGAQQIVGQTGPVVNAMGTALVALLTVAQPEAGLPEITGLGMLNSGAETSPAQSEYIDTTRPSAIRNVRTNVTTAEFGKNLEANGFSKQANGTITSYIKDDVQYDVYPVRTSTGTPGAQMKVNGEVVLKITLQR